MAFVLVSILGSASAMPAPGAVTMSSVSCKGDSPVCGALNQFNSTEWTAKATLKATMNSTGWGELVLETNPAQPDHIQAFSAGYLEAAMTPGMINMAWQNYLGQTAPSAKVLSFVARNNAWVKGMVHANPSDKYWIAVGEVYVQLAGMVAGYNAHRGGLNALTALEIQLLGMTVELGDIAKAVDPAARPDFNGMTKNELDDYVFSHDHCSALVKVTPDLGEIYFSHDTWTTYSAMLRLFKTITLATSTAVAKTVMYSGYPGELASIDDFYFTSQKLAVMETTNEVFNNSLFDKVTTDTVPYWARVTVATRVATTAEEWHDTFYKYNSGTYNNQWMTLDYKKFAPNAELPAGTFWVSEQIPGHYVSQDQTHWLQGGHWSSYNVPFYPEIYEMSGYPAVVKQNGPHESYQLAPRAPIFRREAGKVHDLDSMRTFMRLNRYSVATPDPLFPNPDSAIAARADLLPTTGPNSDSRGPRPAGAIDSKIVSGALADKMQVTAVSGPASVADSGTQPRFEWTGPWANFTGYPHVGHPVTWAFDWVIFPSA